MGSLDSGEECSSTFDPNSRFFLGVLQKRDRRLHKILAILGEINVQSRLYLTFKIVELKNDKRIVSWRN